MSPEAQRIAIAASVGIYLHDGDHAPSNYTFATDLPDYLNDLNAMHEVEKTLTNLVDQLTYLHKLSPIKSEWTLATATARERAEAYLKTIGKWEGGSDE